MKIYYLATIKDRKIGNKIFFTITFKKCYSDNRSDLPELVKSRAKLGDKDSSTVPDTVSNSEVDNLNKKQSNLYKEVHDELGIDYVSSAKEKHNQNIPDWTPEDLEKLGTVFDKLESKEEAQKLFDNCYDDITRAHASVREDLNAEEIEKLEVLNAIGNKEENLANKVVEASGMTVYGVNNNKPEVKEIKDSYQEMRKENEVHYDSCKAELLIASRMSHFDLEERGLNDQHFQEAESNSSSDNSDSESVSSVQQMLDEAESPRFRQDSSDVHNTDFPSWEPGDE